jgi:hypothetical protein
MRNGLAECEALEREAYFEDLTDFVRRQRRNDRTTMGMEVDPAFRLKQS